MVSEIKRNNWSRFLKKFSSSNQYRPATIRVAADGSDRTPATERAALLGVALEKKGRLIDGIQLFTGLGCAESIDEPVVSIKQPSKVLLNKDDDGRDVQLTVISGDGTAATIELNGERDEDLYNQLVGRVAYSLYEHRGNGHGNDSEDWQEAQRRIRAAELSFTE